MKLFVIAALIAVAAAGRLEHLERSYLPPSAGSASSFGSYGSAGAGLPNHYAGASFPGATSNQYLPPNYGSSASNGVPQFAGSLQGFGHNFPSQQYNGRQPAQQYNIPSTQYGTPQVGSSFGASNYHSQFSQQSTAASRQYLAPSANSFQNTPQQSFDEQTGYHY